MDKEKKDQSNAKPPKQQEPQEAHSLTPKPGQPLRGWRAPKCG
jgi:hypothetical protein